MFRMITRIPMAQRNYPGILSRPHLLSRLAAFCLVVLTPLSASFGQPPEVVRALLSDSEAERKRAEKQILSERDILVAALISTIREEDNRFKRPNSVRRAMRLLGQLRAPDGVDVLIEHIGFPILAEFGTPRGGTGGGYLVGKSPSELFPAVNALIVIGEPSIQPIIKRIADEDGVVERRAYIEVLRELEKRTAIRERFAQEIEKSSGRCEERLRHALGWFDNPPESAFP